MNNASTSIEVEDLLNEDKHSIKQGYNEISRALCEDGMHSFENLSSLDNSD